MYADNRFSFDYSAINEIFDYFSEGKFGSSLASWNNDLAFFDNIKNVLLGFFAAVGNFFTVFVGGLWKTVVEIVTLFGNIFRMLLRVTGVIK